MIKQIKRINVGVVTMVALISVFIAAIVGWVMNLFKLISMIGDDAGITTMFIGRIVGAFFPPVGSVLGFM
jgi:hypothetical protein